MLSRRVRMRASDVWQFDVGRVRPSSTPPLSNGLRQDACQGGARTTRSVPCANPALVFVARDVIVIR